jgi:phosphoenolpyruvate carboxykinase (ATP)
MEGKLDNVDYEPHPVFGMMMPTTCPGAPSEILNQRNTWADKNAYDAMAKNLAQQFAKNFEKYASGANEEILTAAPKV